MGGRRRGRRNFRTKKSCERLKGNDFLVPDEGQDFPEISSGMGETYGNQFQRGRISNRKHQEKKTFKANIAQEAISMTNESQLDDVMRRPWKPYEAQSLFSENEISQCKSSQSCSDAGTSASKDREENFRRHNSFKEQRSYTDNKSVNSMGSSYKETKSYRRGRKSNFRRENKMNELRIQIPLFDSWPEPRQFIEMRDGKLKMIEHTSDLLNQITYPSVVISITGSYREGKSYLMNRIARTLKGFSTSSTVQTHTKGIWIWCLPHPTKSQTALILLDTEGLDNAEECNKDQDTMIMSLLMLISSTFIYNTMGKIDAKLIEKLHFVVDVVNKLKVRNSDEEEKTCCDYMMHFPNLILSIRDFYLDIQLNNKEATPDEYFDNMLKMKTGEDSNSPYNLPRTVIRTAFKTHHCFVFPRPVNDDKKLKSLNNLGDNKLRPDFVQEIKKFTEFVHDKSPIKRISEDEDMTGSLLKSFTETCTEALNSTGSNFYIDKITDSVRKQRDNEIVEEAFSVYKQEINKLKCPVINKAFLRFHRDATMKAVNFFCNNISSTDLESQMKILQGKIAEKSNQIRSYNDQVSREECEHTLKDLYKKKIGKINNFKGSYTDYLNLIEEILLEYNSRCGQYDGSIEAKNEFLKSKEKDQVKLLKPCIKTTTAKRTVNVTQAGAVPIAPFNPEIPGVLNTTAEQNRREKEMEETNMEKRNNQEDIDEIKFREKMNEEIKEILTARQEKVESKLNEITTFLKKEERKFEEEGFTREAREIKQKIEEMDRKNTWKTVVGCLVVGGVVAVGVGAAICSPAVFTALATVPPSRWIQAICAVGSTVSTVGAIIRKWKS